MNLNISSDLKPVLRVTAVIAALSITHSKLDRTDIKRPTEWTFVCINTKVCYQGYEGSDLHIVS